MKRFQTILFILAFMALGAVIYHLFQNKSEDEINLTPDSAIIQEQLKNVSKLVVNEAKMSQVYTFKDTKGYFMDMLSFDKKAVVIVNADVTISYDLSKLTYDIDEERKVVRITGIPKEEVKVYPEIKILDVEQSTFNSFKGDDYNKINAKVKSEFLKKVNASTIKVNSKDRLISELGKFLVVTQALGWTLQYEDTQINAQTDFKTIAM